jgi:hypothetical protein
MQCNAMQCNAMQRNATQCNDAALGCAVMGSDLPQRLFLLRPSTRHHGGVQRALP